MTKTILLCLALTLSVPRAWGAAKAAEAPSTGRSIHVSAAVRGLVSAADSRGVKTVPLLNRAARLDATTAAGSERLEALAAALPDGFEASVAEALENPAGVDEEKVSALIETAAAAQRTADSRRQVRLGSRMRSMARALGIGRVIDAEDAGASIVSINGQLVSAAALARPTVGAGASMTVLPIAAAARGPLLTDGASRPGSWLKRMAAVAASSAAALSLGVQSAWASATGDIGVISGVFGIALLIGALAAGAVIVSSWKDHRARRRLAAQAKEYSRLDEEALRKTFKSGDDGQREAVVMTVLKRGLAAGFVTELVMHLDKISGDDTRAKTIQALGEQRAKKAAPKLFKLAKETEEPKEAVAAIMSLLQIGERAVLLRLAHQLERDFIDAYKNEDDEPTVLQEAMRGVIKKLKKTRRPDKAVVKSLKTVMSHGVESAKAKKLLKLAKQAYLHNPKMKRRLARSGSGDDILTAYLFTRFTGVPYPNMWGLLFYATEASRSDRSLIDFHGSLFDGLSRTEAPDVDLSGLAPTGFSKDEDGGWEISTSGGTSSGILGAATSGGESVDIPDVAAPASDLVSSMPTDL